MQLSATLRAPSLALVLLYPEGAGGGSPLFVPRLVAEALDVSLHAESGGGAPNGSGSGSSSGSFSLSVGELEVAEHLAFPSAPSPASSAASSAVWGGAWLPAEEMARVPSVLPPAQHFRWSPPTSAGTPRGMARLLRILGGCLRMPCWLAVQAFVVARPQLRPPDFMPPSARPLQATTRCLMRPAAWVASAAPWRSCPT